MTTTRSRRHLARVLTAAAALAAGAMMTAAELPPQRARAQDGGAQPTPLATTADEAGADSSWCARIPPGYAHPPDNATPLTLQLLQPSVEPVPATDGLIHLPYVAQVTNTQPTPYDIVRIVPVDPLAGFVPTGRNLITTSKGTTWPARWRRSARCRTTAPLPRRRSPRRPFRRACQPGTRG